VGFVIVSKEIEMIKNDIVNKYNPKRIMLFGSQAKGTARTKSDIDLCIVKDTDNKKDLIMDMYINIEAEKPFDLLLYTEKEWEKNLKDKLSFAYLINKQGVEIYGRQ
jgi:uncharacterized protein